MDNIQNNTNSIPEILSAPSISPQPVKNPSRLDQYKKRLQLWWVKLRYGRKPKPSVPNYSVSTSAVKSMLRQYWWIALIVLVIVAALVGWWYMDKRQTDNWNSAIDHYRRADYKAAAPILLKLPMPNDAERLRVYGQTMQATDHPDKAIEAYKKLYEQEKDPFAKLVLGNVYNQQKQYDKAITAYKELIDANPNYIQAYVNLATVYRLQNKNSTAIDVAKQGLQNNANSVVIAELLVSLTMDQPESTEYKEAVEVLRRINPEDPLLQ